MSKESKELVEIKNTPVNSDNKSIQMALMEIVQNKDIDPERLKQFLDLQLQLEDRQAKKAFFEALSSFQGQCPVIKKTKKVNFESKGGGNVKYNYSPYDEIVSVIKPIMFKFGLSYSFNEIPEGDLTNLQLKLKHKDGYEEIYDHRFPTMHDDGRMNQSQRRKSALSFAKRASIENALGIATAEEDDDARRAIDNPITVAQTEEINRLIAETGTELTTFLKYIQTEKIENLSEHEAVKVIRALKAKRSKCIR